MRAILDVPEAVDALCREDCFGEPMRTLMEGDLHALAEAAELALGRPVEEADADRAWRDPGEVNVHVSGTAG